MKTAISLPDALYQRVTKRACELGMSRSELFAMAAQAYLDDLDRRSVTARVDEALALAGVDPAAEAAVRAGRQRLAASDW